MGKKDTIEFNATNREEWHSLNQLFPIFNETIKKAVIREIGNLINPPAPEFLVKALRDTRKVQNLAARTLGQLKDPLVIESLLKDIKLTAKPIRVQIDDRTSTTTTGVYRITEIAEVIGFQGNTPAVDPLIQIVKKRTSWMRNKEGAAQALGGIKDPRAVEPLIDALKKGSYPVYFREPVIAALKELQDPRAVDPLIDALKDRKRGVRRAAAEALGTFKDWHALIPLFEASILKDSKLKEACFTAIGKIIVANRLTLSRKFLSSLTLKSAPLSDQKLEAVLHWKTELRLDKTDRKGWQSLEQVFPVLSKAMKVGIITEMGEQNEPEALTWLTLFAQDADPFIRTLVIETLGRLRVSQALDVFISALKDKSKEVRDAAAWAIGQLHDPQATELLLQEFDKNSINFRISAAKAFYHLKDIRAVEPLLQALKSQNENLKKAAIETLGVLQDDRSLEPLLTLLKDSTISFSLCESVIKSFQSLKGSEAVEPLINILQDASRKDIHRATAEALGECKNWQAFVPLIETSITSDEKLKEACFAAIGKIIAANRCTLTSQLINSLVQEGGSLDDDLLNTLLEWIVTLAPPPQELMLLRPLLTSIVLASGSTKETVELAKNLLNIALMP
ncbi:MAG: HEAT repeat domain-containing protein [Candidatus Hermodarchaeota archaeon]